MFSDMDGEGEWDYWVVELRETLRFASRLTVVIIRIILSVLYDCDML